MSAVQVPDYTATNQIQNRIESYPSV